MQNIIIDCLSPLAILLGGLLFTVVTGAFFIFHPIRFFRTLKDGDGSLKGLNLALAGTLGVGNIVGVVNAIRLGGEGAVFWMVVCAVFTASLKYAEAVMAVKTRRYDGNSFVGGAYFYIEKAFGKAGRILAIVFTLCFLVNTFATGCIMQASAAVSGIGGIVPLPPLVLSLLLAISVWLAAVKGMGRISSLTNSLVPIMTAVYLTLAITVIVLNAERLPSVISSIFSGAFDTKGAIFGIGSFCFTEAMRCGIMRGLLSNEAGCGSSATAHATEKTTTPHRQGCMGVAEVLADTVVMCTVTALAVLTSGADITSSSDITVALSSFYLTGGKAFSIIAALCIFTFGFATVICFAGYGSECIGYIFGKGRVFKFLFGFFIGVYTIATAISPLIEESIFLHVADLSMGIMSLINIPALIVLSKDIRKTLPRIEQKNR